MRHRLAVFGGLVLLCLYFIALFADFLAPYPYDFECRKKPYHPPVRIHFFDERGFSLRPFIYNYKTIITKDYEKKYVPIKDKRYYIHLFHRGEPYKFLWIFPTRIHLFGTEEPAHIFLLGSDWNGRDIFSRLVYGSRISLSVGLLGVLISFTIGLFIGGIAGYFGGTVDFILMRIVELIMCFPSFYLMIALRAAFPLGLPSTQVYLLIILIMSLIGWAGLARVIRGIVLSVRENEYVKAAKAIGVGQLRIIIHHALPNTFSYAIVAATLSIPGYILGESALSLLGLGITEPQASWGNMLTKAMSLSDLLNHPWILTPGVAIFIAIMGFNLLGDGLRDAFDPRTVVTKR
jgi:peptide/nickel transport system permease protein